MSSAKPRVVKDYDKLPHDIKDQIKLAFPNGFFQHLLSYTNKDGLKVSALPFETDSKYYLVRMTIQEAMILIEEDDDFEDGILKDEVKEEFKEKFADVDYMSEFMDDEEEEDTYGDQPEEDEGEE
jgi:hypothetical protein